MEGEGRNLEIREFLRRDKQDSSGASDADFFRSGIVSAG